jgi:hypothetical protein
VVAQDNEVLRHLAAQGLKPGSVVTIKPTGN